MGQARLWYDMSWPEIKELASKLDIALLPIGATEQHGHHCPAGVDFFNAEGLARMVSEQTGAIVAPGIPYGSHPYFHYGFVGTIPIRAATQMALVRDVVKGIADSGFNKIIIIQAHGQWWTLHTALQEIALELNVFMAIATWWELACKTIKEVCSTPFKHADEVETSVSLALYPEKVDMSKAKPDRVTPYVDPSLIRPAVHAELIEAFPIEAITFMPPEGGVMKVGCGGDPRLATAEKGQAIVDRAVERIVQLIVDLQARYRVGEVPQVKPL